MNEDGLKELYARRLADATMSESCPDPEALRAVVEHRASADERLETMRHVARCRACQRDLALLGQVADTRPRALRPLPRWSVAAAAAVLVLGAIGVLRTRTPADPVLRGGDGDVALVSPSGDVAGPAATRLVWRSVPRALRYEIEISDADGSVVFQASVSDTVTAMPDALPPGVRHFWRVSAVLADGSRVGSALEAFSLGPR